MIPQEQKTLSASKSVNVHNKNKNIVTLKMMNIISNENITFDNINPNTVLKTIDTMKDSKKIMALPESLSYHPNLTAYVLDNVFCEETCKKIDQLRNKIELDLKGQHAHADFLKNGLAHKRNKHDTLKMDVSKFYSHKPDKKDTLSNASVIYMLRPQGLVKRLRQCLNH